MSIFDKDIIERNNPLEAYQNLPWDDTPIDCMHELYKFVSGGKQPSDYMEYDGIPEELKLEGIHNLEETYHIYSKYIFPNLLNPKQIGYKLFTRTMQQSYDSNGNGKYNRPQGSSPIWIAAFLDYAIIDTMQ